MLLLVIGTSLFLNSSLFNHLYSEIPNLSTAAYAAPKITQTTPLPLSTEREQKTTSVTTLITTHTSIPSTPIPGLDGAPDPSSSLQAQVVPLNLTTQNCYPESLGYRCILMLWLSTPANQTFSWSASSTNLQVQFNPAQGTCISGQPVQVIAYLQSFAGKKGQLVFTFTSAAKTYTARSTWQG
jgi:hypothetical protein